VLFVAATQFSSTFATVTPMPDDVITSDGRAVTFDVLTNDVTDATERIVKTVDLVGSTMNMAGMDLTLLASSTVEVPGTVSSSASTGSITFVPTPGFTGVSKFDYTADDSDMSAAAAVLVTITVGESVSSFSFLQPNAISTEAAVGTVRGGLFNVATVTPAGPNAAALTSLLKPVNEGPDNFAANTSLNAVKQNFGALFASFFNSFAIFRGGN
jgi:hypothetical protein